MDQRRFACTCLLGLVAQCAVAQSAWSLEMSPAHACGLMGELGLATVGGYRALSESTFRCGSRRKPIPWTDPVKSSLRYYAQGSEHEVTAMFLELRVGSIRGAQLAHRELLRACERLVSDSLRMDLPQEVGKAIMGGVDGSWRIGNERLTLNRRPADGFAYELRLAVE
jgi:hypothetical protein